MELIGYFLALLIGVSLGLIGGGGSILTLPVLVFMFKIDPVIATTYSLFIVGISSASGVFSKLKNNLVDYKTALMFGLPSLVIVILTRQLLLPIMPDYFNIGNHTISKSSGMLFIFALLMVFASFSMIKNKKEEIISNHHVSKTKLVLQGISVGLLTGLLGAGGGFIIIPALVVFSKLPMKIAVGTSLLIITVNSFVGLSIDLINNTHPIDWKLLSIIAALSIAGTLIGSKISLKANPEKLKKGFGWFVFCMGIFILLHETLLK